MNYYNENNPKAAAWLRQLIKDKLIPQGHVDERSITEVRPADVAGFTQCHFFAGIGGWPLALAIAGVSAEAPLTTGSCPCQPFSCAGQQRGFTDERHLWPIWFELIRGAKKLGLESFQCVFGEQVERAVGLGWLDGVFAEMEGEGYACGASVLGAHSSGAPNIRQRIFWMAFSEHAERGAEYEVNGDSRGRYRFGGRSGACNGLSDTNGHEFRRESSAGEQSLREQNDGDFQRLSNPNGEQADAADARGFHTESGGSGGSSSVGIPHTQGGGCGEQRRENRSRDFGHTDCGEQGSGVAQRLGDSNGSRSQGLVERRNGARERTVGSTSVGSEVFHGGDGVGQGQGFWDRYDIIHFKDGKARRIEPGTFPLVNGFPCRVDLLGGYGNGINPWTAAIFIETALEAAKEAMRSNEPLK